LAACRADPVTGVLAGPGWRQTRRAIPRLTPARFTVPALPEAAAMPAPGELFEPEVTLTPVVTCASEDALAAGVVHDTAPAAVSTSATAHTADRWNASQAPQNRTRLTRRRSPIRKG
jgi:hypothetical protein